jgi:hypothetical protein
MKFSCKYIMRQPGAGGLIQIKARAGPTAKHDASLVA